MTPRLPIPDWVADLNKRLDEIHRDLRAREALGGANEAIRRLRHHRETLLKENVKLRAQLVKMTSENEQLQQVIISKLKA